MSAYLGDKLVSLAVQVDYNTNDATAGVEDVLQGEVFYNAEGRQVGTHVCPTVGELLPELSNPAGAEQILSGYEAIDGTGALINGVMEKGANNIMITRATGYYNAQEYTMLYGNTGKNRYCCPVTTDKQPDNAKFIIYTSKQAPVAYFMPESFEQVNVSENAKYEFYVGNDDSYTVFNNTDTVMIIIY